MRCPFPYWLMLSIAVVGRGFLARIFINLS